MWGFESSFFWWLNQNTEPHWYAISKHFIHFRQNLPRKPLQSHHPATPNNPKQKQNLQWKWSEVVSLVAPPPVFCAGSDQSGGHHSADKITGIAMRMCLRRKSVLFPQYNIICPPTKALWSSLANQPCDLSKHLPSVGDKLGPVLSSSDFSFAQLCSSFIVVRTKLLSGLKTFCEQFFD